MELWDENGGVICSMHLWWLSESPLRNNHSPLLQTSTTEEGFFVVSSTSPNFPKRGGGGGEAFMWCQQQRYIQLGGRGALSTQWPSPNPLSPTATSADSSSGEKNEKVDGKALHSLPPTTKDKKERCQCNSRLINGNWNAFVIGAPVSRCQRRAFLSLFVTEKVDATGTEANHF